MPYLRADGVVVNRMPERESLKVHDRFHIVTWPFGSIYQCLLAAQENARREEIKAMPCPSCVITPTSAMSLPMYGLIGSKPPGRPYSCWSMKGWSPIVSTVFNWWGYSPRTPQRLV